MKKIYCGIRKTPKGKKLGSMEECANKKQVMLYGLHKVDKRFIQDQTLITEKNKLAQMSIRYQHLRGTITRNKKEYENIINEQAKEKMKKIINDDVAEINALIPKINALQKKVYDKEHAAYEKQTVVKKSKSKSKSKSKIQKGGKSKSKSKGKSKSKDKSKN